MTPIIRPAETAADYRAFADLCRAYIDWCCERYAAIPWFVEEVFGHQSFDDEQRELPIKYGPPKGRTLLAELDGAIVAGGAYHRLEDGVCEIKRLFVSDAARGHGLGRKLAQALMNAARAEGYTIARLDTATLLHEAIALYHGLGFKDRSPYLDYPERFAPHIIFMERAL
jgi:GNAT superfamily N-acetyltransferase